MKMDILEDLVQCQSILYKIYIASDSDSLSLLNEFCAEFLKCCNKLHKVLIFDCQEKYDFVEIIFLCLNQIILCIKYIEKTIKVEQYTSSVLALTKQFFLDRILWCFAKMKSLINSVNDDVFFNTLEDTNFVDILDAALEYLVPYSNYDHEKSAIKLDAKLDSQQLRTAINKVISQALAFSNVAQSNDNNIINSLCQKVLRDCIDFQNEFSLSNTEDKNCGNEHNIHLKAVIVENALYKLEDFINECLLRLIYHVFTDLNHNSIENIRKIIKANSNDEIVDHMIADFDINVDRLLQIGMFAATFAPNSQVKAMVRNSLASLESLDSHLVPSLYSKSDLHFTILEEHFIEEMDKLKKSVQTIVETDAFSESLLNILNENLNTQSFNLEVFTSVIKKADLLLEHIKLNESELKLTDKHDGNEKYENFKLMVNECHAVLNCSNQIDSDRILKRFKIMRSCLKKFRATLNNCNNSTKLKDDNVFIMSADWADSQKLFESFGISPTVNNILYQSKRNRRNITGSLVAQCSRHITLNSSEEEILKKTETKIIKRRNSLRTAMFKRQQNEETQRMHKIYNDNSMNLGLSEILDQLTNLSSSFQNITIDSP